MAGKRARKEEERMEQITRQEGKRKERMERGKGRVQGVRMGNNKKGER